MRAPPLAGLAFLAAAVILAGACGGGPGRPQSPEAVVRAWSAALDADDNERAADLFAEGATVVQGDFSELLATHEDAVRFNASLPCSGEIVDLVLEAPDQVRATFVLGDRRVSRCDGPGQSAAAIFVVEDGQIVLWQQVAVAADSARPHAGDAGV